MGFFSRGRAKASTGEAGHVPPAEQPTHGAPATGEAEPGVTDSASGAANPHNTVGPSDINDVEEVPTEGYADLGVIKLKPVPGMQMNLPGPVGPFDMVTFLVANAAVQVSVFAAPRGADGWSQRRQSIRDAYGDSDVTITEDTGRYGSELLLEIPVQAPDGRSGIGIIRMVGVCGDRWVAQFAIQGAAVDATTEAAAVIDAFIDSMIIDRGKDPRPPYSAIPITVPSSTIQAN